MKTIINFIVLCFTVCLAQAKVKTGDFLRAEFKGNNRLYVAEVFKTTGNQVSCRFLHSNSVYYFKNLKLAGGYRDTLMQATVVKSKGGFFQEGHLFDFNISMKDPEQYNLSTATEKTPLMTVATFLADNKSYLANVAKIKTAYLMGFLHSKRRYEVDENLKVTNVTGGGYAVGSKIQLVHTRLLIFNDLNKISFLPNKIS